MAFGKDGDEADEAPAKPTLEIPPFKNGSVHWDSMWQYRGKSLQAPRPVFTGDVFFEVGIDGTAEVPIAGVLVLQHPCALRSDGNELLPKILVAEVRLHPDLRSLTQWNGSFNLMPLTGLLEPRKTDSYAGFFDDLHFAEREALAPRKRVACMDKMGIALLMQRWTYHNTRVAIPTPRFKTMFGPQYAEADGIEDYNQVRSQAKVKMPEASKEATEWLDANMDDIDSPRRSLLNDEGNHKKIVKRMAEVAEARNVADNAAKAERLAPRAAERAAVEPAKAAEQTEPPQEPSGEVPEVVLPANQSKASTE